MRTELQAYAALRGRRDVELGDLLREQKLELDDVYRAGTGQVRSGWTALKRDAGLLVSDPGPEETYFSRRFADLLHVDDSRRRNVMAKIGAQSGAPLPISREDALVAQMLAYQVDGQHKQTGDHESFSQRLRQHPEIAGELSELATLLEARSSLGVETPLPGLEDTPMLLHAGYGIREILTGVGWLTAQRRSPFQSGTLPLASRKTELLFVTLDKSEGYHARISYHDYAISPDRFHWQTQNEASPETMN